MNKKFEIVRKLWHSINGIIIAACYQFGILSKDHLILLLSAVLAVWLSIEYLRSRNSQINRACIKVMLPIIRKKEMNNISGVPFYLLGCLFVLVFFNQTIAILSILYLAIGDSIASLCGRKWGSLGPKFINGKSYVGLVSAVIACTITSYFYLKNYTSFTEHERLWVCSIGGIIGGVAELISLIDDNLFIPIFSGFSLFLFFYLF